jgi:hypothetical protein
MRFVKGALSARGPAPFAFVSIVRRSIEIICNGVEIFHLVRVAAFAEFWRNFGPASQRVSKLAKRPLAGPFLFAGSRKTRAM